MIEAFFGPVTISGLVAAGLDHGLLTLETFSESSERVKGSRLEYFSRSDIHNESSPCSPAGVTALFPWFFGRPRGLGSRRWPVMVSILSKKRVLPSGWF